MSRGTILLAGIGLVVAGCTGTGSAVTTTDLGTTTLAPTTTTVPPTTLAPTTTLSEGQLAEIQYEADVKAIKSMWRSYSDAWFGGIGNGYEAAADYNHQLLECTVADYETAWDLPTDTLIEVIVDAATIERDDSWAIPVGTGKGLIPQGRTYIMTVTVTDAGLDPATKEVHASVIGDKSFFFYPCR